MHGLFWGLFREILDFHFRELIKIFSILNFFWITFRLEISQDHCGFNRDLVLREVSENFRDFQEIFRFWSSYAPRTGHVAHLILIKYFTLLPTLRHGSHPMYRYLFPRK